MASNNTMVEGKVVVNFQYKLDDQHGRAWLTIQELNGRLVAKLAKNIDK